MLNIGFSFLHTAEYLFSALGIDCTFRRTPSNEGVNVHDFLFFVQNIKNKLQLEREENKITEVTDPCAESWFFGRFGVCRKDPICSALF